MSTTYLVGVDGSDHALKAARYAAEQARSAGASLVVAHAIDWSGFDIMGPEELAERHKIKEAELDRAQTKVIQPVLDTLADMPLEVSTDVHHGHPAKTLLDLAEQHGASHIFLARNGHTRLAVALLGSTAHSVIQTSPIPVTVVP
jgi:nucleotide-binding universal stress UspA family protein